MKGGLSMKLKQKIFIGLVSSILLTLFIIVFVSAVSINDNPFCAVISYSAEFNQNLTAQIMDKSNNYDYNMSTLSIDIMPYSDFNNVTANVTLSYNNKIVCFALNGEITEYSNGVGFFGDFDGEVVLGSSKEMVVINMYYVDNANNYTALSVCGEELQVYHFGNMSETVSDLSKTHVESMVKRDNIYENMGITLDNIAEVNAIDGNMRFQSTATKKAGGYDAVTVSLFHPNQMDKDGTMYAYAKINSHLDYYTSYLDDSYGSLVSYVYDVRTKGYYIEIVAANKYLRSNRSVIPANGATSQSMTFVADVAGLGRLNYGVALSMDSTSVSYRGVAVSPIYNDNIVCWNVSKDTGWNESLLGGYYNNSTGAIVRSGFVFDGETSSNISTSLGANGRIKYSYNIEYPLVEGAGKYVYYTAWTDTAMCSSALTIVS